MKINYQEEVKVWVNYEIPLDVILEYNKDEKNLDDLFSVDKACENGLDLYEYFDEEHWESMDSSSFNETGETWQEEYNKDKVLDMLNDPEIYGDEDLMNIIMNVITQHKNK